MQASYLNTDREKFANASKLLKYGGRHTKSSLSVVGHLL